MGKINVLDFEIANLIAAGEVVDRPGSVMKELIENSIDSGATSIIAEIKRGGVALIRVTDNGSGIEKDDLPVALKRHATSKIRGKDDLDSIMTLGFRGEALAAISSVSNMTIITKTRDAEVGYMLSAEAGRVVDLAEVGAADGTTVVVNDLFYNVPARRKFLKKDATEAMNVAALVEKVALSRPDISIQLLIDGEERFKTPGDGKLLSTVYAVFGKAFSSKLIEVRGSANGVTVHGYVGRSDNVKKNRNNMNIFINGRYVKSLTAQAAVERAFTSYIAPECFPSCVLFLEMNPGAVDVNVHPAKLEVKFSDERAVFETVYYSVKSALEEHEYRPEMTLGKKDNSNPMQAFVPIGADTRGEQIRMEMAAPAYVKAPTEPRRGDKAPIATVAATRGVPSYEREVSRTPDLDRPLRVSAERPAFSGGARTEHRGAPTSMTPRDSVELLEKYRASREADTRVESSTAANAPEEPKIKHDYKMIGEAFDCYVMIEYEGALLIIDKHAAHERIIFERLKRSREEDGRIATQLLMLPVTVILDPRECECAAEYKEELSAVGFEYNVNVGACDLTVIPNEITPADAETLFVKMLDEIVEGRGNPAVSDSVRREKALYQIACKAAIKGGRVYNAGVIEWLVEQVLSLPDITVCPHGRPIAYRLTKHELDRQFDRIK
ncbi:MAG: DNA mismatch repair endonuclease MutL [Clostridia bacterium]|nr:DNA mismatch repair endonuclease MutL [Clostridia bacterium]